MRQLFLRFYLTVVVCFLISATLIGGAYKHLIDRTNQRYLIDIFKTTVTIIEEELGDLPRSIWHDEAARLRGKLPVPVQIESVDAYQLSPDNKATLLNGGIILLSDKELYLHRIHQTELMVVLGPIPYLSRLEGMSWIDWLAMALMCAALGIPTWLWMRPFWRDVLQLIKQSRRLGNGDFTSRVELADSSALAPLGVTFNRMANDIQTLTASRRAMLDAVSHDLRTPLTRIRYRLEALKAGASVDGQIAAVERDLGQIDQLLEEWLTMSTLDRAQLRLNLELKDIAALLELICNESAQQNAAPAFSNATPFASAFMEYDSYYLGRAVTNLLSNAHRYGGDTVQLTLAWGEGVAQIHVDDNGPGIPDHARERLLQPFERMENSRNLATGGFGLGLSIVAMIMRGHNGEIRIETSPLGGARITLAWPTPLVDGGQL
ncbi:ATP-binding protein [Chitinilyticum piscinae]|uniref:histidine kinase n=1 Tax=Chitinilyticum piscinae TaxID=2866724 RepID=A0A8J7FHD8_9NEIS|nr:ATP-binding protein [Chitinilyticum piscinae]MBE9607787.1 two-component system sensor histidine kinase RstB [Chitinilyticum piscinae]